MNDEKVMLEAYRLIRQKVRNISEPLTDEQLGQYVRGVVDLQTELWDANKTEKEPHKIDVSPLAYVRG